jgi:hypothetical protein
MSDFFNINRNVLILRPKQAMIDWVNAIFPEDPIDYNPAEQHDTLDVFLISDFDSVEEALSWLKENCAEFLSYELETYCADDSNWPEDLNWALFERFFEYSIQLEVVDTVDEEEDEEFDDFEDFDDFDDE